MKRTLILLAVLLTLAGVYPRAMAEERLRMSTTTSTENSGLLTVLLPPFEKKYGCHVDVIAVGTGRSLKLGEAGDVDVVFVHARKLEDKFVADGFGVNRRDVMYNDFVIIGPADDPAGIKSAKTAAEAFRRIAQKQQIFISRGDESGTHIKERELWEEAGIKPEGRWYRSAGQGMGEIIMMATEQRAYTLSDRGTYNAFKHGKTDLQVLYEGEKGLFNPYGVIAVNPQKFPHSNYALAMKFVDFVTGPEGQAIISGYKIYGEPVFFIYKGK
jgi:tungstate transport system substrate-binding protein